MLQPKLQLLFVPCIALALSLTGCGGVSSNGGDGSFKLSASPSSVSLAQDGQATSSITITPLNGFSGDVTLSASGLPSGVTASFTPNPATGSSLLTFAASPTAITGTVTVTIMGTSGALTDTMSLGLTTTVEQAGQIKHVVIIVQENRTPDNLFHDPVLYNPPPKGHGADIALKGKTSTGQTVTLTPVPMVTEYDMDHGHKPFLDACDYNPTSNSCAMDGADLIPCGPAGYCPVFPQYQYVQQSDVQPYFTMAETYTFADRMFQTNEGDSFPAHLYLLSGTSAISDQPGTSNISASANPFRNERPDGSYWSGCLAPPGAELYAIDTSNPDPLTTETLITQLCYEHPTLTDLLNTANISWTYYTALAGSIWTAPDAIQHMCVPSPPAGTSDDTVCTGSDWTNHVVVEGSHAQIITDITSGQLAHVVWVIPTGANSDHAGGNTGGGPSWVASIVNAVGESPYWADTAIIVTWDDWGGWYDHVPPSSIRNSYEYGLRVPMLVISAYAKPAYVSHVNHDFGSILKFVEKTFSLGEIDPAIGYADSRSDDLSDCFNFSQKPLVFTPIASPLGADHFLNDTSPPTPPDDD